MLIQNISGYFEHIKNKTYIDRYPSTVINPDELRNGDVMEFGCGFGNDVSFLIENLIVAPNNYFLIESNADCYVETSDRLEKLFFARWNPTQRLDKCFLPCDLSDYSDEIAMFEMRFQQWIHTNLFFGSVLKNNFADNLVDFVYANNFLHCLGYRTIHEEFRVPLMNFSSLDKIIGVVRESYRLLRHHGVFFGRTLSNQVDLGRLVTLENKLEKSEKEEFVIRTTKALQEGELVGISRSELEAYATDVGFTGIYIEIRESEWKPIIDFYFRFEK